jgi:hypothetical protein
VTLVGAQAHVDAPLARCVAHGVLQQIHDSLAKTRPVAEERQRRIHRRDGDRMLRSTAREDRRSG